MLRLAVGLTVFSSVVRMVTVNLSLSSLFKGCRI